MASGDLVRYVITVMLHEDTLTEINELNNYLTRDGFLLTMTDDDGNIHELGTNTFGLISTQSEEEIREGANKRGNSSRLTQSFHFFMFE
ncbi:TPA: type V toxin-antitoxin system endoribonuclease antitoxin GhoS, partial [Escherichia coli]|uniref:type V toxin-antitoxin system endoribonuclease antitoxin GhoS n=2 Tax=Escherichia coli TaxID=562 RepID=UPI001FF50539